MTKEEYKEKERKFDGIWNAERILANCLRYSNESGCIPYTVESEESPNAICRKRFYAALRAYGKIGIDESLFGEDGLEIEDITYGLLSKSRSQEKMKELREIIKENMRFDSRKRIVDEPGFFENDYDLFQIFRTLFKYRKELQKLENIWGGVLECSKHIGTAIEVTKCLYQQQIFSVCNVIDRMLVLLLGDDFDRLFTEEELFQYGYPDVTDEELYKMESEVEW